MEPPPTNPVVHLELHTEDVPQASSFYADLFGWRPETIRAGSASYLALAMGRGLDGGMVECSARRPLWLPYVQVSDVRRVAERAQDLGAAVTLTPREGPVGWRAVVAAEAGGEIALWQPKR
jgi:predicted enzyme related to lactoylglutathione lyase